MAIEVYCSNCGHSFRATHVTGRRIRCPECERVFTLPESPDFEESRVSNRLFSPEHRDDLYDSDDFDDSEELEDEEELDTVRVELLREDHPELYGALLSANQKLESAGGTIMILLLALGGVVCLAAGQKWIDALIKTNCDFLREWWGYVGIMVAALMLGGFLSELRERRVFASVRGELFHLMEDAGFSRYTLIATLEGSETLAKVAEHLKKD